MIQFYRDLTQRKTLIDAAQLNGDSMIHDDFIDTNGNPTDGTSGRLEFGTVPNEIPTTDQTRLRALFVKVESGTMTQDEIIEVLKLALVRGTQ